MHDRAAARAGAGDIALDIGDVTFSYGSTQILKTVSLRIRRGQIIALLGPSGCGKSTLLKLVAGLLRPDSGTIRIMGKVAARPEEGLHLPPEKRDLGMVFQDYALWPHMTVGENVDFPLRMAGMTKGDRRGRVETMLARVGLAGFAARRPADLSGGQQQRVALARAMVGHPSLVLFDEPLSNLDRELRSTLAEEIADLLRAEGLSGLYVTHDQAEAFSIADTVVVMSRGDVLQEATPQELIRAPASADVAEFMALGTVLEAELRGDQWCLEDSALRVCSAEQGPHGTARARVLLRPERLRLQPGGEAAGIVCRKTFTGAGYRTRVRLGEGGQGPELTTYSEDPLPVGARVGVIVDPEGLNWFT
jgi:iron(III) transport system ATP-binding protein